MSGLYRKALNYLHTNSPLRLVRPDELGSDEPGSEEYDISEEDQESINAQIELVLEQNKIKIDDDTFKVKAEQKGGVLPVIVNVVAILLIAGGFFAALYYFNRQEQDVSSARQSFTSAESRVLETMAAESERRLSAKNTEITSMQRELASMLSERQSIQSTAEESIRTKEAELEADFQQQIEAERARLGENGLSAEALTERMNSFESELKTDFDSKIEEVINQANLELKEQENTLNSLISEYEQSLDSAEAERTELSQDLEKQRIELEEELTASEAALAGERAEFSRELRSMQDQRENENLVLDQLLASYKGIEVEISRGRLELARGKITELRGYLDDIELSQLPVMQNRRPVELFLVDSLGSLVEREIEDQSIDTTSLLASANSISAAIALAEEGNSLVELGNYQEAKEKYLASFGRIPALMDGYISIQQIDARFQQAEEAVIRDLVNRGDAAFLAGKNQDALDLYAQAVRSLADEEIIGTDLIEQAARAGYLLERTDDLSKLAALRTELDNALSRETALVSQTGIQAGDIAERDTRLEQLLANQKQQDAQTAEMDAALSSFRDRLTDAEQEIARLEGFETAAGERSRIAAYVAEYTRNYTETLAEAEAQSTESADNEMDVLTQLETKLAMVTILNSEGVREEYPNLSERMNDYLGALITDNTEETRITTLEKTIAAVDKLIADPESFTFAESAVGGNIESRLFAEFIGKLALLLR